MRQFWFRRLTVTAPRRQLAVSNSEKITLKHKAFLARQSPVAGQH
jgi:hypothetical protein